MKSRGAFKKIMNTDFTNPANTFGRSKAIRMKCVDCTCGNAAVIKACQIKTCPLWPWRMGRPLRKHEWKIQDM